MNELARCVVRVHGQIEGTGFFFRRDGSILTCFHLIGNLTTGKQSEKPIRVVYAGQEYAVSIEYTNPEWDIAILRIEQQRLPKGVVLFTLAAWEKTLHGSMFQTFGYRPPRMYDGLYAHGVIVGSIRVQRGGFDLQLAPQAVGEHTLRQGMSGAPVYIEATNQIVGMIKSRTRYTEPTSTEHTLPVQETMPIAVSIAEAMKHVPLLQHVGFVNREHERRMARGQYDYAPRCIVFDAPARYGKTNLLCAVESEHERDGWHCIHVETSRQTASASDLARQIAVEVGIKHCADASLETIRSTVIGALQVQMTDDCKGIAFFIDNIEHVPRNEIHLFLDAFLAPLFDDERLRSMRVRMAGCYVGGIWECESRRANIPLKVYPLSPFRFEYICDTIQLYRPEQPASDLFAAHLMHITGGHPGCMRAIINESPLDAEIEYQFSLDRQYDYYDRIVRRSACDVYSTIPEDLRIIFDTLCVFRRYDLDMLKRIAAARSITNPLHNLLRALTATYFITLNPDTGFYGDTIIRRLLMLRLYWEDRERFVQLCMLARQIYQETRHLSASHAVLVTIECLYQELQLAYYTSDHSADARLGLRDRFFAEHGILNTYMQPLLQRNDAWMIQSMLIQRLREAEEAELDWEFRFIVNFLLRDDMYLDTPYQRLLQTVEAIFSST